VTIIQCPHCFTQVIPKSDGTCPACQRNTRDREGIDDTRRSIRISQGDVLPPICCDCGEAASVYTPVSRTLANAQGQPSGVWQILMALFLSWPMAVYFFLRGISQASVVQVRLPQCARCRERAKPSPRYVDFPNARMTFVVHKNLLDAMAPESPDDAVVSN
jgi:hypothetical protein